MTKWSKNPNHADPSDLADPLAQLMASDERFAASIDAFKASVSAPIDGVLAEKQITAIVRAAGRKATKRSLVRRLSLGARLGVASAVLTAAMGSLAYAGVLPAQMQDALSKAATKAGFHIPSSTNHGSSGSDQNGKSVSNDVHKVLDQDLTGREKGQQVSDTADQNRQNENVPTSTATDHPTSRDSSKEVTPKGNTHKR